MTLVATETGNRAHSLEERGADLYETPPIAVHCLLQVECIPLCIWEPSCGPGSIVRTLRETGRSVIAQDLHHYGCEGALSGVDFLTETKAPNGVPAIVMNPPYKLAEEFVFNALKLVPEVHALMRLGFLGGQRWRRGLDQHLARVHIFNPRLPMMHRGDWQGPRSTSAVDFMWCSFQRDWVKKGGQRTIDWVNWREVEKTMEANKNVI